jgi:2-oxoglutarate ferredoxin oxidoreductase subunit gamma
MQEDILIAGFGGQGVLFAGQLMAYAAMDQGFQVTWIPSYGPEMRGGTANCTVIISDEEIGAPIIGRPKTVLAFNRPSLDKYEPLVKPGGLIVVNTSIIDRRVERNDIRVINVPANQIAEKLGDKRLTNMVMMGALLANLPILTIEAIANGLRTHLPERHKKLIPGNIQALSEGGKFKFEPISVE